MSVYTAAADMIGALAVEATYMTVNPAGDNERAHSAAPENRLADSRVSNVM